MSPQCLDTGRKSLRRSSNSKVAAATDAPAGIPGSLMTESAPEDNEPDETKLVSVVKTPWVDSHISGTNNQYDIKTSSFYWINLRSIMFLTTSSKMKTSRYFLNFFSRLHSLFVYIPDYFFRFSSIIF